MTTWSFGGGFSNVEFLSMLLDVIAFYKPENHRFSVFDAPYGCIWEGGRPFIETDNRDEDLSKVIEVYNEHGVGFNFVFSNSLLKEEHTADNRGNYFLERHHNSLNKVILSSEILLDHLRSNFPDFTLIYSLTHGKNRTSDLDFYRRAQEKYDLVVLVPDLNTELDFVRKLEPSRLEILINETCFYGCSYRTLHYKTIDWLNLNHSKIDQRDIHQFCSIHDADLLRLSDDQIRHVKGLKLTVEQIQQLMELGVEHFKVSGRLMNPKANVFRADITNLVFPFLGIPEIAFRIALSGRFDEQPSDAAEASGEKIRSVMNRVRKELKA